MSKLFKSTKQVIELSKVIENLKEEEIENWVDKNIIGIRNNSIMIYMLNNEEVFIHIDVNKIVSFNNGFKGFVPCDTSKIKEYLNNRYSDLDKEKFQMEVDFFLQCCNGNTFLLEYDFKEKRIVLQDNDNYRIETWKLNYSYNWELIDKKNISL